jgi:hypothetical protein
VVFTLYFLKLESTYPLEPYGSRSQTHLLQHTTNPILYRPNAGLACLVPPAKLMRGGTSKPERREECFQTAQLQLGLTTASRPESPCWQPRVIEIIHCEPATPGRHTTAKKPRGPQPR